MEFTVFRSRNGFFRRAEWVGVFEKRDRGTGEVRRKLFRKTLPFLEDRNTAEDLWGRPWSCDGLSFSGDRYSGSVQSAEGELRWNLELSPGTDPDFSPLSRWLKLRTCQTRIPVRGSWTFTPRSSNEEPLSWSSDESPARGILQTRDDSARIWPTVWFHCQAMRDTGGGVEHLAEGLHARPGSRFSGVLPQLTSIRALDPAGSGSTPSLWQALRTRLESTTGGWTFRSEHAGRELRGRIEADPRHWVTIRHEDFRGEVFYRTTTRMARLEVLALEQGKPQGFFSSGFDTWVEWTTRSRPIASCDLI